jgi:spermidine/putrescine transport system ATP-binding protein
MGIRPEKISLHGADDVIADGRNKLEGAEIIDAGFTGMSTQFVVRLPWGQEGTVFAQNIERDLRLVPGARVTLSWNPGHGFGLAPEGAAAGAAQGTAAKAEADAEAAGAVA